jgi:hypothetical protein
MISTHEDKITLTHQAKTIIKANVKQIDNRQ